MLGEGFLRVLRYNEERPTTSTTKPHTVEGPGTGTLSSSNTLSAKAGSKEEALRSTHSWGLELTSQPNLAVSIPGCSPALALDTTLSGSCSLLQQYPDLRLGQESDDSGCPLRSTDPTLTHPWTHLHSTHGDRYKHQREQGTPLPDQGYLVMGSSLTRSLEIPGSGTEPMSNSLLNGFLGKQLDEVYLQHLTDSLARCNFHPGNSLLWGLVPPPQPSGHAEGPDSLEARLGQGRAGEHGQAAGYLSTQNTAPCSSHFSSPVLRISEDDRPR